MLTSVLHLESPDPRARDTLVLRVRGDVDPGDRDDLDRLLCFVAWGDRLHVDLAGVGAFSASLLGWLARLASHARALGVPVTLGRVPRRLARFLRWTGLGDLLSRTVAPLEPAEDPEAMYASAR